MNVEGIVYRKVIRFNKQLTVTIFKNILIKKKIRQFQHYLEIKGSKGTL